jgi:hypothetical protein
MKNTLLPAAGSVSPDATETPIALMVTEPHAMATSTMLPADQCGLELAPADVREEALHRPALERHRAERPEKQKQCQPTSCSAPT